MHQEIPPCSIYWACGQFVLIVSRVFLVKKRTRVFGRVELLNWKEFALVTAAS